MGFEPGKPINIRVRPKASRKAKAKAQKTLRPKPKPSQPPATSDSPATRTADLAKADKYKQSQHYIDQLQATRGDAQPAKSGSKTVTGLKAQKLNDKRYFGSHDRTATPAPAKPDTTPARFQVDPSTGAARVIPPPKQAHDFYVTPHPGKPQKDQPRTDAELRKFLRDGKPVYGAKKKASGDPLLGKLGPSVGMVVGGEEAAVPKLSKLATSLFLSKETARPLNAVAAGLQGKNVVKGFTKGTDTGSDVLKHYHLDKKLHLGKVGTFIGGELLNTVIDPLQHGKLGVMSPKEAVERKAGKIEARAGTAARPVRAADAKVAAKVDKLRAQAKNAGTNRGFQVGVTGGVPLTHHHFHVTTKGHATAKVARALHVPQAASRAHDSGLVQKVGHALVPHFRDRQVDPVTHRAYTEAQRKRVHAMHTADREAENRAHAFDQQQQKTPDSKTNVAAAIEGAPKGPTPEFRDVTERSPEHRAVTVAQREERSAKHAVTSQQGRANFETNQHNVNLRHKLADIFHGRDKGLAKMDASKVGHADARVAHVDVTAELEALKPKIKELEARGNGRTADEAKQLAQLRLRRLDLAKFKRGLEQKWGTYAGEQGRAARELRPLDESITHLQARVDSFQAIKRTRPLTAPEARGLAGAQKRLARFHGEVHLQQIEPAVRTYIAASGRARTAATERSAARKAHRNAHGEDPFTGGTHPATRQPIVGAEPSYTDKERAKVATRVLRADAGHAGAQASMKRALSGLEQAAEKQASAHARGEKGVSILRHYDRRNPGTLKNLETARATSAAATATRRAAQAKAKGVPQFRTQFKEVTRDISGKVVPKPGARTWREFLDSAPRHSPADLSRQGRKLAQQHIDEMSALRNQLHRAGLLDTPADPHYLHHMDSQAITDEVARQAKETRTYPTRSNMGRAAKTGLLKARTDPRPIMTQHEHGPAIDRWETDLARINANYIHSSKRAIADAEYLKSLKGLGTPISRRTLDDMRGNEGVYAVTNNGVHRVTEDEARMALAGKPAHQGEHVILPKYIGEREVNVRAGNFRSSTWGQAADAFHRHWKTIVTVGNMPFYQQRNLYDDTLRFWYGDGDMRSYGRAIKLVQQQTRLQRGQRSLDTNTTHTVLLRRTVGAKPGGWIKVGGVKMPVEQFLHEATQDGITGAGHFASEFEREGGKVRIGSDRSRPGSALHKGETAIRNAGTFGENIPRMATYLSARNRGMTREQATSWTRIHHFDYTEITDDERILRRWVPFWTFTSRNLALQSRTLLTRPGKFSQFEAFRQEAAKLAGLPPNWDAQYQTQTQQRALPIPIRFGTNKDGTPNIKVIYPSLSNSDIARFAPASIVQGKSVGDISQEQAQLFLQQIGPLAKTPVELLMNHSFFFNQPIYQGGITHETNAPHWVPAPPFLKDIPGLKKYVRTDFIGPDGKVTTAIPAVLDYVLRTYPQTGFIVTATTPSKTRRGQTAADRVFGQLTGVRAADLDKTGGELERLYTQQADLTNQRADMQKLAQRGTGKTVIPQAADRQVPAYSSKAYTNLGNQLKAVNDRIDAIKSQNGKAPSTRLLPRPLSYQDQQKQKRAEYLKTHAAGAYQAQGKAYRDKQKMQAIINRGG